MKKHTAIRNLYPSVRHISTSGDDIVIANDENGEKVVLDENAIDKECQRIQAEYDAKQYQRDRNYPEITEQLDLIYWDKKNGTNNWLEAINKVKSENPKP